MTKRQKYRDVAAFLRSEGWYLDRTRGSHEIWKSEDGSMTQSVARHGDEVSAGIIRQLQTVFPNTPEKWKQT